MKHEKFKIGNLKIGNWKLTLKIEKLKLEN